MAENSITANLRRIRRTRSLSQEQLARRAGLSRAALRNIEGGKAVPRVATMQALGRALGVRIGDLTAPARELRAVRFRSRKRLRTREQILVDVGRWLSDFNEVEEISGDRIPYALRDLAGGAGGVVAGGPRAMAARVREAFGLSPTELVRDICGLLESHGIKVFTMRLASHDFFGLSVAPQDGGPAIAVNTWDRISVERWIFTAAHELGHLVLHLGGYDVAKTDEADEEEAQANAFAAEILMPGAAFQREWDETYGLALVDRVLKMKRMFRVSYLTVLHRLSEQWRGPGNVWARFQSDYRRRSGRTLLRDDEPDALAADALRASFPEESRAAEPEQLSPVDFEEDRLSRLVRRAVEQGQVTLGRAAEVLGLSLREMSDLTAAWIG